jgi:lysophospholipase L1-like esterase
MIKNFKWLFLVATTFIACNNNDDDIIVNNTSDGLPLTAGTADFSKYVALGDSFAAGFSDNALFIEGQKGAYPNILAQQFALVGGGSFSTPFMADNVGGFAGSPIYTPRLYLAPPTTPGGLPSPSSVALAPYNQIATTTFATLGGSFNNMGIPGARSFHLITPGYGSSAGNPYFARFASNPLTTVLDDAIDQEPTFFSLWIGGNDVLGYATSGGVNEADITPTATFDTAYNQLASQLSSGGRKGVVANLPYVNSLPFFITVPTNPIPALPAANAAQLNQLFGGINAALVANGLPTRFVTLTADDGNTATSEATNPLLIVDESLMDVSSAITNALTPLYGAAGAGYIGNLYGKVRHARNTVDDRDFILLTSSGLISPPNNIQPGLPPGLESFSTRGVTYPLQDAAVLTADEALKIKNATDAYNITIQTAATTNNLAFVDTKSTMYQIGNGGITNNGFTLTSTFATGGAFSLDGIHPSPRGYALIANEFIKAINTKYGSNLKGVSFADYRIMFPPVL